jgi:predicted RNase H-like HicB family nuclease
MSRSFTVEVHQADDGTFWAQVREMPGCFATGDDLAELTEAVREAIGMCLPESERPHEVVEGSREPADHWRVSGNLTLTHA